jgi:hypothetical protein
MLKFQITNPEFQTNNKQKIPNNKRQQDDRRAARPGLFLLLFVVLEFGI